MNRDNPYALVIVIAIITLYALTHGSDEQAAQREKAHVAAQKRIDAHAEEWERLDADARRMTAYDEVVHK